MRYQEYIPIFSHFLEVHLQNGSLAQLTCIYLLYSSKRWGEFYHKSRIYPKDKFLLRTLQDFTDVQFTKWLHVCKSHCWDYSVFILWHQSLYQFWSTCAVILEKVWLFLSKELFNINTAGQCMYACVQNKISLIDYIKGNNRPHLQDWIWLWNTMASYLGHGKVKHYHGQVHSYHSRTCQIIQSTMLWFLGHDIA